MKHSNRIKNLESKSSKQKRFFVLRGGKITEHGEPRTQSDIDQAKQDGFGVVILRVVYGRPRMPERGDA